MQRANLFLKREAFACVTIGYGHSRSPMKYMIKWKKIHEPDIANIRRTRVLLDVFQIVSGDKPVTGITAAWDISEDPGRIAPTSMSDIQGLKEFAKHGDGYLVFHREGEKYDIKLRTFAHNVVLQARPELRDFAISHNEIRNFVGEKVDHRAEGTGMSFLRRIENTCAMSFARQAMQSRNLLATMIWWM